MNLDQIQKQIDELQRQVNSLRSSSTLPRDVENAFSQRLGGLKGTGVGAASTQTIGIGSPPPVSITVPAQPSGTLAVLYKGTVYNLLFK